MARITVEDCLNKIDSQYDLVLLAKERAAQLNAGDKSLVPQNNDKNTVIALREIGEAKISIKTIEDAAINKLRKVKDTPTDLDDLEIDQEDDFDKIYKGEISKSGAAILPSKRVRRVPEKLSAEIAEKEINEKNDEETLDTPTEETLDTPTEETLDTPTEETTDTVEKSEDKKD